MPENIRKCAKCGLEKSSDSFEQSEYKLKNGEISIRYRSKCKKCRVLENKERTQKDPDFWKKQYWSMSEEKRKKYINKKSEQNQRRFKTNPIALANKKEYDRSDKGIYSRYKGDTKRRGRLDRGIILNLNFDDFSKLINSACDYCGKPNCRGIDRIDSSKSYTKENSVPCCKKCNGMKSDLSLEEFMEHINQILKHRMGYL